MAATGSANRANLQWEPEELLKAVVAHSPLALYVLDPEGLVRLWNPAAEAMFGWAAAEVVGRRIPIIEPGQEAEFTRMVDSVMNGNSFKGLELMRRHRSGRHLRLSISTTPLRDRSGTVRAALAVCIDVTPAKTAQDELGRQPRFDTLTGLHTRAHFLGVLAQRLALPDAHDALVVLDINGLHLVNDAYGRDAGDKALATFGARLHTTVRVSDMVARVGGDEFALLLHDVGLQVLPDILTRLFAKLRVPLAVDDITLVLTVSGGVVPCTSDVGIDELLRRAHIALAESKGSRNGCGFLSFEPAMTENASRRARIEADVDDAAERGELTLHYQPTIDSTSGRVSGMEALVRWEHPLFGRLSPDQFIPLAEQTGAIVGLGRWVLSEACAQLCLWRSQSASARELTMSVNLSPVQLTHPGLVDAVLQELSQHCLQAMDIQFEVTETALAKPGAEVVLSRLHDAGFRLAIDDFGTGYSSLTALRRFPFTTLKIDRSFVSGMPANADDRAIVRATIELSKALGLTTVAEGIETATEMGLLLEYGCDELQGFYFSRPASAADITLFIDQGDAPELLSPGKAAAGTIPAPSDPACHGYNLL